jgi:uncharacterized protein YkvS
MFTSSASENPKAVMMVMNHPVLDVILDVLKRFEIGELILMESVFTTMIKVQQNSVIVLIAELDEFNELHDDMNPFSLPFRHRTHSSFPH